MAKELYCPQCNNEYWGTIKVKDTKCNGCGYQFTPNEIYKVKVFSTVPSYRSVSNDNDKTSVN